MLESNVQLRSVTCQQAHAQMLETPLEALGLRAVQMKTVTCQHANVQMLGSTYQKQYASVVRWVT